MKIYREIADAITELKKIDDENLIAKARFLPEFTGFKGHFENQPILPGICQLELVRAVVARGLTQQLALIQVKSVKFLHVVKPDEEIELKVEINNCADTLIVDATVSCGANKVAKIKLELAIED
jgi:3-hydroxyacyl-[acyl-carrier-protein] dehydratase